MDKLDKLRFLVKRRDEKQKELEALLSKEYRLRILLGRAGGLPKNSEPKSLS